MSQQPQSQGSQYGQMGQQTGGQFGQMGQQTSGQFGQMGGQQLGGRQARGRLPPQLRQSLASVAEAIEVCEWCADQCVEDANPNMVECIKLCEDVAEIGETTLALAPRNSRYAGQVVSALQSAVQACGQECSRHQQSHCQECAQVLSRTASDLQPLSQQFGGQITQ